LSNEPAPPVPRVHRDLTTTRIMARNFIEAEPLDVLATPTQRQPEAVGTLLEQPLFRELFKFRIMQTDPNFANPLYQPASGRLALLDFGSTRHSGADFGTNYARISRALVDMCPLACEPLRHVGPGVAPVRSRV
jgi:predicted unusual protein kinase regulating ubiquinone biosynthesis (AarF/ABC1/UbiB family)